ncbi:MAG: cellulase family glycosylhydrolase [bacterium]
MNLRPALAALMLATAAAASPADHFHPRHGLNFDIWIDWQTTEDMVTTQGFLAHYPDWRGKVPQQAIAALKTQGYDFARLPMDPAPLLRIGPGKRQDGLIDQIAEDAALVEATGLKVIVDIHTFPRPDENWGVDTILSDPDLFAAYVALIGKIARRLDGMDPVRVAFEPMNEPTTDCAAVWGSAKPTWPAQLMTLYHAARANAPDLPLVLSGACWGGAQGLVRLDPGKFHDANIIWSFHSYTPFPFTHQGATWTGGPEMVMAHLPYPPSLLTDAAANQRARDAAARAKAENITTDPPATLANLKTMLATYRDSADGHVEDDAALVAKWADKNNIPRGRLLLGEFGANHAPATDTKDDRASRLRFLTAKSRAAEQLGIGWAVWSWSGAFGVVKDDTTRAPDNAICRALGIGPCK